ncbi:MAG: DivIVA domain-containing protein [Oscillospiraceae bacterium]
MFTSKEIRDTIFDKTMRGYNTEDVDAFLAHIADQLDDMTKGKSEVEGKMLLLAEKLEEYRGDEDKLRIALVNAEKMKDIVLAEARQKCDIIIRDANLKAERIVSAANKRVEREEIALAKVQKEAASFKTNLLGIYKRHLETLSEIPDAPIDDAVAEERPAAPSENSQSVPAPMYDMKEALEVEQSAQTIQHAVNMQPAQPAQPSYTAEQFVSQPTNSGYMPQMFKQENNASFTQEFAEIPQLQPQTSQPQPSRPHQTEQEMRQSIYDGFAPRSNDAKPTFSSFGFDAVKIEHEEEKKPEEKAKVSFEGFEEKSETDGSKSRFGQLDFGDNFSFDKQ